MVQWKAFVNMVLSERLAASTAWRWCLYLCPRSVYRPTARESLANVHNFIPASRGSSTFQSRVMTNREGDRTPCPRHDERPVSAVDMAVCNWSVQDAGFRSSVRWLIQMYMQDENRSAHARVCCRLAQLGRLQNSKSHVLMLVVSATRTRV
jgi:hypothetical protein